MSIPLLALHFPAASTTVNIGVVEQAKRVNLQSGGVGGAVVGGAIGYNLGSGNSDSKKRRRAIIGSAIGSAAATKTEPGMEYTVKFPDGSTMAIISNQLGLAVGDCVSVEDAGKAVNIRQQDAVACDPRASKVVEALQEELVEDADECSAAKQELLAAKTTEAVEIATAKAKILCN
jgi:outer membrane lipoprotein SlyB